MESFCEQHGVDEDLLAQLDYTAAGCAMALVRIVLDAGEVNARLLAELGAIAGQSRSRKLR